MAEENKTVVTSGETSPDKSTGDLVALQADLRDLRQTVEAARADNKVYRTKVEDLTKDLAAANEEIIKLEKKLKSAKSAPTGDVVYLDGKSWAVKGTVKAKFALDEVKKGHVPEDVTLVVIDRIE